jgi:endonuclease YncB( thermonuclease family)
MAVQPVRNAGGVPFLTLKGSFVVRQRQMPDGDTVAFVARSAYDPGAVETNVPVGTDGAQTVNIRLQSIDAPEKSQPMGAASRDALLKRLGLDAAALGLSDTDFSASGPTVMVSGWLATHGMDGNQRPLGYVFRKNPGFKHGVVVSAEAVLKHIRASENYKQALGGWAFPAFYDNTDETHAVRFASAAVKARKAKKGVWAQDATTTGFVPTADALHAGGALVYPKFYRRVEKWTAPKPDAAAFINWLKKQADGKKLVLGAARTPMPLWQLFEVVSKTKVAAPFDVSKLWFSE